MIRRGLVGWIAVAIIPLLVLLDSGIAALRGWRTTARFDLYFMILCSVWLALASASMLFPAARRFFARYAPQLWLLMFVGALAWGVGELVAGPILRLTAAPLHLRPPSQRLHYSPNPGVMRGVDSDASVSVNSQGVRGPEWPDRDQALRILCLGGSTTACTYLDDTKTWPSLLMAALNAEPARPVWVGNAGLPSKNSVDHLEFLRESALPRDVDVIVLQVGVNEILATLAGPASTPPLWQSSQFLTLSRNVVRQFSNGSDLFVEDTAGRSYERRRAIRQSAQICTETPELTQPLAAYRERLRAIIARCRELQVSPFFTTQPVLWRADLSPDLQRDLWFGRMHNGRFLAAGNLRQMMDQFNAVLLEVCRTEGVPCLDLTDLSGDPAVFYDDCHFTEEGARRVANRLSEWLCGQLPSEPLQTRKTR